MHPRPHKKTLTDGHTTPKITPIFDSIPTPIPEKIPFGYWRQWIDTEYGNFYLRLTNRCIGEVLYKSFEIAVIHFKYEFRGIGLGTEFLVCAEKFASDNGIEIVYVESISSEILTRIVKKAGYTAHPNQPETFFKII